MSALVEPGPVEAEVVPSDWPDFSAWWAQVWEQGQHVGVIGPTGSGKTTAEVALCAPRKWVAALDPKGGDETLAASGWERVSRWPLPYHMREQIRGGEPARIIVGKKVRTRDDRAKNRRLLAQVVPGMWEQGHWTVVIDELQLLTDRRFMNLANDVVELLIAARNRGISVVSALQRVSIGQATAGASATVGDQVTWLAVAYTRDDRMVQRLAELLGRPVGEVRSVIRGLVPYQWVLVGRDPRAPYILFSPPKLPVAPVGVDPETGEPEPPGTGWRARLWPGAGS